LFLSLIVFDCVCFWPRLEPGEQGTGTAHIIQDSLSVRKGFGNMFCLLFHPASRNTALGTRIADADLLIVAGTEQ